MQRGGALAEWGLRTSIHNNSGLVGLPWLAKSAICVQIASHSTRVLCAHVSPQAGPRSLINSKFVTPGDVWHCTSSRSIVSLVDRPLLSPSTIGGSILASCTWSTCVLRQLPRNLAKVCMNLRRKSAPVNSQLAPSQRFDAAISPGYHVIYRCMYSMCRYMQSIQRDEEVYFSFLIIIL
jgi:hypothetical protein